MVDGNYREVQSTEPDDTEIPWWAVAALLLGLLIICGTIVAVVWLVTR